VSRAHAGPALRAFCSPTFGGLAFEKVVKLIQKSVFVRGLENPKDGRGASVAGGNSKITTTDKVTFQHENCTRRRDSCDLKFRSPCARYIDANAIDKFKVRRGFQFHTTGCPDYGCQVRLNAVGIFVRRVSVGQPRTMTCLLYLQNCRQTERE